MYLPLKKGYDSNEADDNAQRTNLIRKDSIKNTYIYKLYTTDTVLTWEVLPGGFGTR